VCTIKRDEKCIETFGQNKKESEWKKPPGKPTNIWEEVTEISVQ
jgi:hypothetical protein